MARTDESLHLHPLRIAVMSVTDSHDESSDRSGALWVERLTGAGRLLAGRAMVRDEVEAIQRGLKSWTEGGEVDVILTTGGTGFAPRDVTPEAVRPLLRREMDGFAILFHQASVRTVGLSTLQSRALAGQVGGAFLFCLPGSTGACRDAWDEILRFELDSRYRPCSLAGQVPRLRHLCP